MHKQPPSVHRVPLHSTQWVTRRWVLRSTCWKSEEHFDPIKISDLAVGCVCPNSWCAQHSAQTAGVMVETDVHLITFLLLTVLVPFTNSQKLWCIQDYYFPRRWCCSLHPPPPMPPTLSNLTRLPTTRSGFALPLQQTASQSKWFFFFISYPSLSTGLGRSSRSSADTYLSFEQHRYPQIDFLVTPYRIATRWGKLYTRCCMCMWTKYARARARRVVFKDSPQSTHSLL